MKITVDLQSRWGVRYTHGRGRKACVDDPAGIGTAGAATGWRATLRVARPEDLPDGRLCRMRAKIIWPLAHEATTPA